MNQFDGGGLHYVHMSDIDFMMRIMAPLRAIVGFRDELDTAHVCSVTDSGEYTPRVETLPYYPEPVQVPLYQGGK